MLWRRSDGTRVRDLPPYRRALQHLTPRRSEAEVLFDIRFDAGEAMDLIDELARDSGTKVTLFHLLIWAAVRTLERFSNLNRFVAGRWIWQRRGIWLSFSIKKSFSEDAPVVVVKRRFEPGCKLEEIAEVIRGAVGEARSDRPSFLDREMGLFLMLPRSLRNLAIRVHALLDYFGLLPARFIENDVFYASAFLTSLGSIGLDSCYHHLWNYGTVTFFANLGAVREEPPLEPGAPPRRVCSVKVTFDERIEDGFYCARALKHLTDLLERPRSHLDDR